MILLNNVTPINLITYTRINKHINEWRERGVNPEPSQPARLSVSELGGPGTFCSDASSRPPMFGTWRGGRAILGSATWGCGRKLPLRGSSAQSKPSGPSDFNSGAHGRGRRLKPETLLRPSRGGTREMVAGSATRARAQEVSSGCRGGPDSRASPPPGLGAAVDDAGSRLPSARRTRPGPPRGAGVPGGVT